MTNCLTPTYEEDPYADDGEFGSDKNYEPSKSSRTVSESSSETSTSEINVHSVPKQRVLRPQSLKPAAELGEHPISQNQESVEDITPVSTDTDTLWSSTTAPIPNFGFDERSKGLKINITPDSTQKFLNTCLLRIF